ncbi:hypothetical protein [Micromonospora sp. NPDC005203]
MPEIPALCLDDRAQARSAVRFALPPVECLSRSEQSNSGLGRNDATF